MMSSHTFFSRSPLFYAMSAALLLSACGGSGSSDNGGGDPVAQVPKPTTIVDGVPTIDPLIAATSQKLVADKKIQAIVAELNTAVSEKARFNQGGFKTEVQHLPPVRSAHANILLALSTPSA